MDSKTKVGVSICASVKLTEPKVQTIGPHFLGVWENFQTLMRDPSTFYKHEGTADVLERYYQGKLFLQPLMKTFNICVRSPHEKSSHRVPMLWCPAGFGMDYDYRPDFFLNLCDKHQPISKMLDALHKLATALKDSISPGFLEKTNASELKEQLTDFLDSKFTSFPDTTTKLNSLFDNLQKSLCSDWITARDMIIELGYTDQQVSFYEERDMTNHRGIRSWKLNPEDVAWIRIPEEQRKRYSLSSPSREVGLDAKKLIKAYLAYKISKLMLAKFKQRCSVGWYNNQQTKRLISQFKSDICQYKKHYQKQWTRYHSQSSRPADS